MSDATGLSSKLTAVLNTNVWEGGAAIAAGANDQYLADSIGIDTEKEKRQDLSVGQEFPTSSVSGGITSEGPIPKMFRFGSKDHLFLALCMGAVSVQYRSKTALHSGTATGGSATQLDDSAATFGATDVLVGKTLIIDTGGTARFRVEPITANTGIQVTTASGNAYAASDTYEICDFGPAFYDICDGTATANTIKSTIGGLTVNAHAGSWLHLMTGTGAEHVAGIVSNTADTFTISGTFATTPDATTVFEVMGIAASRVYSIGDLAGKYCTLVNYNNAYFDEYPFAKIHGFKLTGDYNDDLKIEFTALCDRLVPNSAINTSTAAWSIRELANSIAMKASTVSILRNAQAGAALSSGTPADVAKVNNLEFTYLRPVSSDYRTGAASDDVIEEPIVNDSPEVLLKYVKPRVDDNTDLVNDNDDTDMKGTLTVTGAALSAHQNREFVITMPHLEYKTAKAPIEGRDTIKGTIEYFVNGALAAPSGMTYTDAITIDMVDDYGGNPLLVGNN